MAKRAWIHSIMVAAAACCAAGGAAASWAAEGTAPAPAEGAVAGAAPLEAPGDAVWRMGVGEAIALALEGNRGLSVEAVGVERGEVASRRAWEGVGGWEVSPVGSVDGGDGIERREAGVEAEWTGAWGTRLTGSVTAREWDFKESSSDGGVRRRGEVRVGIEQPLLRGFGTLVREEAGVAADEAWRAARRSLERRRSALAVQVAECWEGARYLARQVEADMAQAERLERLCALADVRERRGTAGRTEVLRMQWQLGEARQRVENGRAGLDVKLHELADLMGLGRGAKVELAESPLIEVDVPGDEAAVATAWRERPEVAQAEEDLAAARRGIKVARRGLLPDVAVSAEKAWWGEGAEWDDALSGGEGEWRVGLEGRMPLRMAEARLDVADRELEAKAAAGRLELARDAVALDVRTALAEWRRARAALGISRENRARAEERGELARALFEAGRGTADAVSDAEADVATGLLGEAGAERDVSVAGYRLLHVLGRLVEMPEDLR